MGQVTYNLFCWFLIFTTHLCLSNCIDYFRLTRYKNFKEGHKRILVATDLVGRGIDIERVNIVINYDMPDSADTYLHRVEILGYTLFNGYTLSGCTILVFLSLLFLSFSKVGRAGRFGTKGLAITFVASASDSDVLNQVNNSHYILWFSSLVKLLVL